MKIEEKKTEEKRKEERKQKRETCGEGRALQSV